MTQIIHPRPTVRGGRAYCPRCADRGAARVLAALDAEAGAGVTLPNLTAELEPPDEQPVGPCAMCPHYGEDHWPDGTCEQCSCERFVEYTRADWEADQADIAYSCWVEEADR